MKDDPYTLLVALDKDGKAEGLLYADDGETLAHQQGYFVLRRFVFANSKLSVTRVNTTDLFPAVNIPNERDISGGHARVERIVVIGHPKFTKVTLAKRGTKKELEFDTKYFKHGVSIKQPGVEVESLDWTITLS